jgi:acyl-CoA reductase-like NAD-dependent aldehyde dehydrogenase
MTGRMNPVTGEVATTAPAMTAADANSAADRAAAAFPAWSALGPNSRRALLNKAANALEAKATQFIEAMMRPRAGLGST